MTISPRCIGRLADAGACLIETRSMGGPLLRSDLLTGQEPGRDGALRRPPIASQTSTSRRDVPTRVRLTKSHGGAFTLLEVMIAMAIFFIAIFSILELTSRCLRAARGLQRTTLDPASLASSLSVSNKLEEGSLPADLVNSFEHEHPGSRCDGQITLVSSNGLYRVDFQVYPAKGSAPAELSILLYRPESTMGLGGRSLKGKL